MASFNTLPSGRFRAQVAVHGKRRSRAFLREEDAKQWAANTEATLRLKREVAAIRGERMLASMMPRRVLEAKERVEHTAETIVRNAFAKEETCGVYFLILREEVVYVGKSVNIFGRIGKHIRDGRGFDSFNYVTCAEDCLSQVEADYIAALLPFGNQAL